ncbi:acyltransferase family protein [Inquilinus sp. YAF38]|uniref:acyltransferase family protein n=1 Tax=Inquilinus sp. YAF38 TaxID=3233084 RepID=UPI003F90F85E
MLLSIQACRGIAALLVVLYHLNTEIFHRPKYFPGRPFGSVFDFGHSGVEFFFVLSGFIIVFAHGRDIGRVDQLPRYLWRRFQRIYPIYWVVLVGVASIYFTVPSFGKGYETDPVTILSSFTLVYADGNTVVGVAWTLYHEILFYAAFAALIWNRTAGFLLFGAWGVGIVVFHAVSPDAPSFIGFLASPMNLLFPLGMLSAVVYRSDVKLPAGTVALVGALVFLACGAAELAYGRSKAGPLVYGLGSALLIVGLGRLEATARIRIPRLLVYLGAASYSIYLTHFPLLSLFAKIAVAAGLRSVPDWLSFFLIGSVAVAVGCAFHAVIERPLLRWIGNARKVSGPHPQPAQTR